MKRSSLLFALVFCAVTAFAQPPAATPRPVEIDPATGNYLPLTINGHVPNLPAGSTVGGTPIASSSNVSDTAFASSWNGVLTIAPSKNVVYDHIHLFDTDDDGKVNVLDLAAGIPKTDASGVLSLAVAGTDYVSPSGVLALAEFSSITGTVPILVANTLFVDKDGNDASGLRERADKPFLTLTAAKTAATSGDTIHVRPGTYNETNLLKNGVNWYFDDGAIINYTGSAASVFHDGAGAVSCSIGGYGVFQTSGSQSVVRISNSSSGVYVDCKLIDRTFEAGTPLEAAVYHLDGFLDVRATIIRSYQAAAYWEGGEGYITADKIESYGPGVAVYALNSAANQHWHVKAQYIVSAAGSALDISGSASARIWVDAHRILASNYFGILQSGSVLYVTAQKIQGPTSGDESEVATVNLTDGVLYLHADKVEGGGGVSENGGAFILSGGQSFIDVAEGSDLGLGGTQFLRAGGGTHNVRIGNLVRGTSGNAVVVSGGTLNLVNSRIDNAANASTNAITVSGGTVNIQNAWLTSHASGFDVSRTAGTANLIGGRGTNVNGTFTTSGTVTTLGPAPAGDDTAYDATSWNGNFGVPTKNAIRDKIETLSGGSGNPGGSTTQLQYNNAGAFGGITGATTDGTTVTLTEPTGVVFTKSVTEVSFTAVADTTVFTVPAGKTFVFTGAFAVITSVSGYSSSTLALWRITDSANALLGSTGSVPGASWDAVGEASFNPSVSGTALLATVPAGGIVKLRVTQASSSTTLVCTVHVMGFYY